MLLRIKTHLITTRGYILAIVVFVGLTWWWSEKVNTLNQKIATLSKTEAAVSSTPAFPLSYYEGMVGNVLGDLKAEDALVGFSKNASYYQSQYIGDQNGVFTPDNRPADIDYLASEFALNNNCVVPFEDEVVWQYNDCMFSPVFSTSSEYAASIITPYASIEVLYPQCLTQAVAQSIEDGACGKGMPASYFIQNSQGEWIYVGPTSSPLSQYKNMNW